LIIRPGPRKQGAALPCGRPSALHADGGEEAALVARQFVGYGESPARNNSPKTTSEYPVDIGASPVSSL
jgi:hypothetical protein